MTSASAVKEPVVFVVSLDAIDAGNVAFFRTQLEDLFLEEARIVLDLSRCEFVDSAGLGAIVWAVRRLSELSGEMCICGSRKPVQALFELVRMHKLVASYETQQEAIDSLAS